MSKVTNVILVADTFSGDWVTQRMEPINAWLREHANAQYLVHVDDPELPVGWYGGSKMLECEMAIGAFNYLDLDAFLEFLRNDPSLHWNQIEDGTTQLLVLGQDDTRFTLHDVYVND